MWETKNIYYQNVSHSFIQIKTKDETENVTMPKKKKNDRARFYVFVMLAVLFKNVVDKSNSMLWEANAKRIRRHRSHC